MNNVIYVQSLPSITIGRKDDNLTNEVRIDCSLWIDNYPNLTTYRIEYVNSLGQKNIALNTTFQDSMLIWTITNEDTAVEGEGKYQIIATGKNGEQKASREATLYVRSRIHGDGQEESVEYMKPLLDQVAENASRAEEAAKRAEEAAVGKVPFATSDTAGVVKVGEGLTVEEDGTLSVVGGASPSDPSEPGTPGAPGEDGEDGGYYTPSVNEDGELTWTASKEDMPKVPSSNIKGEPGNPGAPGEDGKDGFSPTVEVIKQDGIATFTVTDKNGTSSIEIADGKDGKDGEDGEPGAVGADGGYYTPSVSQFDNKMFVSFTPSKDNMPEIAPVEVDLPVPNPSESVFVDPTLTNEGQAADAKVVGEAVSQLSEEIEELDSAAFVLSAGKNLFNPATAEVGAIQSDGSVSTVGAYAGYSTSDYIGVEQQTDYTATIVAYDATGAVSGRKFILLFDDQKNVVSGTHQNVNNASLTFNTGNAHYVRMSGYVGSGEYPYKLQLEKGDMFTGYEAYTAGVRKLREPYPDILREKKWVVIGDSFTQGGYRETDGFDESVYKFQSGKYAGNNITYPYIIAERTNLKIVSFFNGGRTLANPADGSFVNSITNPSCAAYYQNVPEDANYVTIYLGINDSHHESGTSGTDGEDVTGVIPLGTIDDTDASTFCGAWNVVLPWLMTNRPNAHIGIIVSNGVERVEYRTATIAAAKKWGIPYLDLNGDERCPAMIRTVNPDISDAAKDILKAKWGVTTENLHPNTAAHYFQSTFIEAWLRGL